MTAPVGWARQPINAVHWRPREDLSPNDYNPNVVAPPELRLLTTSILEDGWTQPIVVAGSDIVDGFHRWQVSDRPEVWRLTDGMVPTVPLDVDPSHRRLATIRHNRARGTHGVVAMADIVATLVASGMDPGEVGTRLGMEAEEVRRLLDRGDMLTRAGGGALSEAWRPAPVDP